jgi:hypothetical protein
VPEVIDKEYWYTGDVRVVLLAYVLHQLLTPLRGLRVRSEGFAEQQKQRRQQKQQQQQQPN